MDGFSSGINLGGWLSQYGDKSHEHFGNFITERDIAQIASWGLDHVRLPVDYPVIESDDAPGTDERVLDGVRRAIRIPEHEPGGRVEAGDRGACQLGEGVMIALPRSLHEV